MPATSRRHTEPRTADRLTSLIAPPAPGLPVGVGHLADGARGHDPDRMRTSARSRRARRFPGGFAGFAGGRRPTCCLRLGYRDEGRRAPRSASRRRRLPGHRTRRADGLAVTSIRLRTRRFGRAGSRGHGGCHDAGTRVSRSRSDRSIRPRGLRPAISDAVTPVMPGEPLLGARAAGPRPSPGRARHRMRDGREHELVIASRPSRAPLGSASA